MDSNSVKFLEGDNAARVPKGTVVSAASDYDYRKVMANSETKKRAEDFFAKFDAQDSLGELLQGSIEEDYRNYSPLLFLPEVWGLDIKIPDFVPIVCPNSTTVNRDPVYTLEVEASSNAEERIKFLAKGASTDSIMHDLGRRSWSVRSWGSGWRADRDDLADIPIDFLSQRLRVFESDRRRFRNAWVSAIMYDATNQAAYDNVYSCAGATTTGTDCNGNATTHVHGISVEDILMAKKNFRTDLQKTGKVADAMGVRTRGQDYYSPEILVIDPNLEASLTLEIFRKGYSTLGPETLSSQVRTLGNLSNVFGMTVVSMPTYRWVAGELRTPENWEWDEQAYILDSRWGREIVREQLYSQNYYVEPTRQWVWSLTSRTNFEVADSLAIMRLQPCSGS